MGFKKNVVKTDLGSYPPYILQGQQKAGKSTLFRDLVLLQYGAEDAGLLISCGDEDGYLALDKLQYEVAENWNKELDPKTDKRGLVQIVEDVITNNKENGIKAVAFDTFDKMVEILIVEVLKIHRREMGTTCKSLNDALGGFQKGRDRLILLMLEQIKKLRQAGIAVFVIAHTKFKEKTDPLTGVAYDQLTNNLRSDIYSAISHIAQMIVTISVDKVIEEGKIIGETRNMNFRNNGTIDCGCRFPDVPDKLPLSAENFMKAFDIGVKSSFLGGTKSQSDIDKMKQEEIKTREANAVVLPTNEELVEKIKEKITSFTPEEQGTFVKMLSETYGITSLKEPDSLDNSKLMDIVANL